MLLVQQKIERLIEIGPSDTLTSMAKKTLAAQPEKHDALVSSRKKLFSYKKDRREIRYETDTPPERVPSPNSAASTTPKGTATVDAVVKSSIAPPVAISHPNTTVQNHSFPAPVASLPDTPITAKEIIITIIAQKLHKQFNEISCDKTIKQLVGGRYTVSHSNLNVVSCRSHLWKLTYIACVYRKVDVGK